MLQQDMALDLLAVGDGAGVVEEGKDQHLMSEPQHREDTGDEEEHTE